MLAAVVSDPTFSRTIPLATVLLWFLDQQVVKRNQVAFVWEAAVIQEDFDRYVFDLPWPKQKGVQPPTEDRIRQLSLRVGSVDRDPLVDWYAPESIPENPLLGAIHCQRMNCWWDVNLRQRWSNVLKAMMWMIVVTGLVLAVARDVTVADLIALGAASIRVIAWVQDEIYEQSRTIVRARNLHSFLSTFSSDSLPSACDLWRVQDEILEQRRASRLVPDWYYRRQRAKQEAEMQDTCAPPSGLRSA